MEEIRSYICPLVLERSPLRGRVRSKSRGAGSSLDTSGYGGPDLDPIPKSPSVLARERSGVLLATYRRKTLFYPLVARYLIFQHDRAPRLKRVRKRAYLVESRRSPDERVI